MSQTSLYNQHEPRCNNLIINYIPAMVTEDELRERFGKFGKLLKARIIRDKVSGCSLGFGFVKFSNNGEAAAAITSMNGLKWGDKILKVSVARPEGQAKDASKSNVYLANLPLDWTEDNLITLCGKYGEVSDCRVFTNASGASRGCAMVKMNNSEIAQQVISQVNGILPEGAAKCITAKEWQMKERIDRNLGFNAFGMVPDPSSQFPYGASADVNQATGYGPTRQPTYFDQRYNPSSRPPAPRMPPTPGTSYPPMHEYPPQFSHYPPTGAHEYPAAGGGYVAPNVGYAMGAGYGAVMNAAYGAMGYTAYPLHYAVNGRMAKSQPSKPINTKDQISLFVFHLPPEVTDEGLRELFQPLATNGEVISAKVIITKTGESKGFGFVNFSDRADAQTAIDVMNGYQMGNKYLKVNFKN